jgi:hypothetical protein
MTHRHLLVVAALRAGEVSGATSRVSWNDGGLLVVIDVAALFTLLTVSNDRAPFSDDDPTRNFYGQRVTSEKGYISSANCILPKTSE